MEIELECVGPKILILTWHFLFVEVGYLMQTTTPGWIYLKVWRIGFRRPPFHLVEECFTTIETIRKREAILRR